MTVRVQRYVRVNVRSRGRCLSRGKCPIHLTATSQRVVVIWCRLTLSSRRFGRSIMRIEKVSFYRSSFAGFTENTGLEIGGGWSRMPRWKSRFKMANFDAKNSSNVGYYTGLSCVLYFVNRHKLQPQT